MLRHKMYTEELLTAMEESKPHACAHTTYGCTWGCTWGIICRLSGHPHRNDVDISVIKYAVKMIIIKT